MRLDVGREGGGGGELEVLEVRSGELDGRFEVVEVRVQRHALSAGGSRAIVGPAQGTERGSVAGPVT